MAHKLVALLAAQTALKNEADKILAGVSDPETELTVAQDKRLEEIKAEVRKNDEEIAALAAALPAETEPETKPAPAPAALDTEAASAAERERIKDILAVCKTFKCDDRAQGFIDGKQTFKEAFDTLQRERATESDSAVTHAGNSGKKAEGAPIPSASQIYAARSKARAARLTA
jgi:hypothetical protein